MTVTSRMHDIEFKIHVTLWMAIIIVLLCIVSITNTPRHQTVIYNNGTFQGYIIGDRRFGCYHYRAYTDRLGRSQDGALECGEFQGMILRTGWSNMHKEFKVVHDGKEIGVSKRRVTSHEDDWVICEFHDGKCTHGLIRSRNRICYARSTNDHMDFDGNQCVNYY